MATEPLQPPGRPAPQLPRAGHGHRSEAERKQRFRGRKLAVALMISSLSSAAGLQPLGLAADAAPTTETQPPAASRERVDESLLYRNKLQLLQNLLKASAAQAKQNGNYRNYCSALSIAIDVINSQLQRLSQALAQRTQEQQRLKRLQQHYGLCRRAARITNPQTPGGELQI
jgi:hypothetical protein